MDRAVFILYKGEWVYYNITKENNGSFTARLSKCSPCSAQVLSPHITLTKEGRHWRGTDPDQDLLDDIGNAIES